MDPNGANLLFSLLSGLGPSPGLGPGGGEDDEDTGPRDAVTCPVCLKAHLPRGGGPTADPDTTSTGPTPSSSGANGGDGQNANPSSSSGAAAGDTGGAANTTGGKDYGALQVYVQSKCPICLEESGPPVVALPCGHCVCRDDYFRMGGSFLDEANPRDLQPGSGSGSGSAASASANGSAANDDSATAGTRLGDLGRYRNSNDGGPPPIPSQRSARSRQRSAAAAAAARGESADGGGSGSGSGSGSGAASASGSGTASGTASGGTGRRRRHNRWTNDEEEVSDDDDGGLPVDLGDFLMDAIARQMMGGGGGGPGGNGPPMPFPFAMMPGGPPFGPPFGPPPGYYDDSDDDDDDDDDDSMPPLESRDGGGGGGGGSDDDDDDDDSSMPPLEEIAPVRSERTGDLSEVESDDDTDDRRRGGGDDSSHDAMPPLEDGGVSTNDEDNDDDDDDDMPPLEPLVAPSAAPPANQEKEEDEDSEEEEGDEDEDHDDDMPSLEPALPSRNGRSPSSTLAPSTSVPVAATSGSKSTTAADAVATRRNTDGNENERRGRGVRRQRSAIGATTFAMGAQTDDDGDETKTRSQLQAPTETRQTSAPASKEDTSRGSTSTSSEPETGGRRGKRRRGRGSRRSDAEGLNGGDDSSEADTALAANSPSDGNKKEETNGKTESYESGNKSRGGKRNKEQQDQDKEEQQNQPKKISVGAKEGRHDAAAAAIVPAAPLEGADGGLWLLSTGKSDDESIKLWHANLDGTVTRAAVVPAMSRLIPDGMRGAFVHSPIPAKADEDDKKRGSLKHITNGKGTLENYRRLHKDAQVVTDGRGGIWALYPSQNSEVMVLVSAKKWSKVRSGQRTIGTFSIASSLVGSDDKGGVYVHVEKEGVKASGDSAESENPDTVNEVGLWRVDHRGSKALVPPQETDACMVDGHGNAWFLTKGHRSKKRKLMCLSHSSKKKDEAIEPLLFVRQPLLICGGKNGGVFVHAPGEDKYSSWSLKYVARDGDSLQCTSLGDCPRSAQIISDGGDGVWIIKKSRTKGEFPSLSHMSPSKPCEFVCELPFMPEGMHMSTLTS